MLNPAKCTEPAINGYNDTGYKFRILTCQPKRGTDQILRFPKTTHWGMVQNSLPPFGDRTVFLGEQGTVLFGKEEPGSQGIDPDPHRRKMDCQPLGKVAYRSFGPAV